MRFFSKSKSDPYRERVRLLQEFLYARAESSDSAKRRFGCSPSETGRILFMRDGLFRYSEEDVDTMLKYFQKAINALCGCKSMSRLPM